MSNHESVAASAFATLSLVDLDTVCGGADTNTSATTVTVNPKLECPAGTTPNFQTTTGGGSIEGHGPALGGSAAGGGSRTTFSCDPIRPVTPPAAGG